MENKWYCMNCGHTFKGTGDTPDECPKCHNSDGFLAVYAKSRVHGDRYAYYNGSSDWVRSANAQMKDKAHGNFIASQSH